MLHFDKRGQNNTWGCEVLSYSVCASASYFSSQGSKDSREGEGIQLYVPFQNHSWHSQIPLWQSTSCSPGYQPYAPYGQPPPQPYGAPPHGYAQPPPQQPGYHPGYPGYYPPGQPPPPNPYAPPPAGYYPYQQPPQPYQPPPQRR